MVVSWLFERNTSLRMIDECIYPSPSPLPPHHDLRTNFPYANSYDPTPARQDQFSLANLPTLLNEWSDVYDFTASKGANWALESPLVMPFSAALFLFGFTNIPPQCYLIPDRRMKITAYRHLPPNPSSTSH